MSTWWRLDKLVYKTYQKWAANKVAKRITKMKAEKAARKAVKNVRIAYEKRLRKMTARERIDHEGNIIKRERLNLTRERLNLTRERFNRELLEM
jgi:hypothetical protein